MKASNKWPRMFQSGSDREPALPIGDEEEVLDLDQLTIDDLRMPGRDPLELGPESEISTRSKKKRRLMPIALAGVMVVGVVAVTFLAYGWFTAPAPDGDLPMVQAIDDPVKVKPESPGGMEVPYQEQLVLNGEQPAEGGEPVVERLLPPPESPQWPPTEPEGLAPVEATTGQAEPAATTTSPEPSSEPAWAPAESAESEGGAALQAAPQTADAPPEPGTKAPEPVAEAPEPAAKSPEPAAKASEPVAPIAGTYLVQLASIASREATKPAWKGMQAANPDLLGDLAMSVQKAEVKGKTYYRIQAGPFPNRPTAMDVCAQLKAKQQDCLVVRR